MASFSIRSILGKLSKDESHDTHNLEETEADRILTYVKNLINRTDLVSDRIDKYEKIRALPTHERETAYIPIYFLFEDFIANNKPLVVKYIYTKESLRKEIAATFHVDLLPELFRLIFLPEKYQNFILFEIGVRDLADFIKIHLGASHLQVIVRDAAQGTVLAPLQVDEPSLHFDSTGHLDLLSFDDIIVAFRKLYTKLYHDISESLGENTALNIINTTFHFIKSHYEYDLIARFLEVMPEGMLENERLAFLNRTELEKKIRQRTHELEEEKSRLQASVESVPLGFIITDNNDSVISFNAIAHSFLLSVPLAEDVQNKLNKEGNVLQIETKRVHAFNTKGLNLVECCQLSRKEKKPIEIKDVTTGNKFYHIFISPIRMPKPTEEVIGNVILIEDITETKLVERSKDEFFSIASHELRTPLTAIRGYTSLIHGYFANKVHDEEILKMIHYIDESSQRLIDIVNDFLDVSRLEQGKMMFKQELFDIRGVIEEVIHSIESLAKTKGLYIRRGYPQNQKTVVLADRSRTKQIIVNLLGNAIKFSETGGVTIEVNIEGKFVLVTVSDTGKGIPLENRSLLFRKFQQAGETILKRDATRGTGLGLYISKILIGFMGGEIYLRDSTVNKGTAFVFTLPVGIIPQVHLPSENNPINDHASRITI